MAKKACFGGLMADRLLGSCNFFSRAGTLCSVFFAQKTSIYKKDSL
jgi:hypothetical protein